MSNVFVWCVCTYLSQNAAYLLVGRLCQLPAEISW